MATYSYKATNSDGKLVSGTLEAAQEKEAVNKLQDMRYIPIRVRRVGKKHIGLDADLSAGVGAVFNRVSTRDVVAFTQDLSALLEAGVPLDRALSILIEVTQKDKFKVIIKEVLKSVQGGSFLSAALEKYPDAFSGFYVSMIRAGEAGGVLDGVLKRLGIFLESTQDFKDHIKSAMIYPLFLVLVGGLSIIILLTFVMPRFSVIFSDMGQALPFSTRMLMEAGVLLKSYWPFMLGGAVAVYFIIRRYFKTPSGSLRLDRFKLYSPVVGELVKTVEVARFARTLGTLEQSGVPILQALQLVRDIMGNQLISGALGNVYNQVKKGEKLSRSLTEIDAFPPLAIQMIIVGEETGRMGEVLLKVAANYEKASRDTISRMVSLFEPVMILVMGIVVGFIVISMIMGMFSIYDMPF